MARAPKDIPNSTPQIESGNTLAPAPDFAAMGDSLGAKLTEWLKLRTDQIEQRVDLKVSGLEKEVSAKLDNKPGHGAMIGYMLAAVTLIIAVMAIAGDRFSSGMSATGAFSSQLVEREKRDQELNKNLTEIRRELGELKRLKQATTTQR